VTIWDLTTSAKIAEWTAGGHVRAMAWAPAPSRLATAGEDGVTMWKIHGPTVTRLPATPAPGAATAVAFSADGAELLAAFDGERPRVVRLRVSSPK